MNNKNFYTNQLAYSKGNIESRCRVAFVYYVDNQPTQGCLLKRPSLSHSSAVPP